MATSARPYDAFPKSAFDPIVLALSCILVACAAAGGHADEGRHADEKWHVARIEADGGSVDLDSKVARARQLALSGELESAEDELRPLLGAETALHTRAEALRWLAIVADARSSPDAEEVWQEYGSLLSFPAERLSYERSLAVGRYYATTSQLDRAGPLLLVAYDELSRSGQLRSGHLLDLAPSLVEALLAQGKQNDAARVVDQELDVLQAADADDEAVRSTYDRYAEMFNRAGYEQQASEYRRKALKWGKPAGD